MPKQTFEKTKKKAKKKKENVKTFRKNEEGHLVDRKATDILDYLN